MLKVELELEENRHRQQHKPPPSTPLADDNPLRPFFITPRSIIPLVHDRFDDPSTCIIQNPRQGISTHATYHHGPADWKTSASKTAGRNGWTRGGLPPMGHLHSRRRGGGHGRPPFLVRNVLHGVNYPNRTIIRFKKKKQKRPLQMKSVTRLPSRMVKLFSDSDNDEDDTPSISRADILDMCQRLAMSGMQYGDPQFSLNLSSQLRIFRVNYDKKN
jgi:hypothetical protein